MRIDSKDNHMKLHLLSLFVVALLIGAFTCGCSGGDSNTAVDKVAEQAGNEMATLGKSAKSAGGDYDKLPEDVKKKFLERVGGNEAQAREMVTRLAGGGGPRGGGVAPTKAP